MVISATACAPLMGTSPGLSVLIGGRESRKHGVIIGNENAIAFVPKSKRERKHGPPVFPLSAAVIEVFALPVVQVFVRIDGYVLRELGAMDPMARAHLGNYRIAVRKGEVFRLVTVLHEHSAMLQQATHASKHRHALNVFDAFNPVVASGND